MSSQHGYALYRTNEAIAQMRSFVGMSRRERNGLFLRMHKRPSRLSDEFRDDPANRVSPGSSEIRWPLSFPGDDGEPLTFVFLVDVASAEHGVLKIISVSRDDA